MSASKVIIRDDLSWDENGGAMEFRLTYAGELLASNFGRDTRPARRDYKRNLRKHFHPQLKRLFEITPFLSTGTHAGLQLDGYSETTLPKYDKDAVAAKFQQYGFTFLPLVTKDLKLACWLDILFIRRQIQKEPGGILSGGDIDNRLKTLFDALMLIKSMKPSDPKTTKSRFIVYWKTTS